MTTRIDMHSHILPGVDEGAVNGRVAQLMLAAAIDAEVTTVIATPHLRNMDELYRRRIALAYEDMRSRFEQVGVQLLLRYECDQRLFLHHTPAEIGAFDLGGSDMVLLEFSASQGLPPQWQSYVEKLQREGKDVIIAHSERYPDVKQDIAVARRMLQMVCELQLSATFLGEAGLSAEKRAAKVLLQEGLVSYIASDAHMPRDYISYHKVMKQYGEFLRPSCLCG